MSKNLIVRLSPPKRGGAWAVTVNKGTRSRGAKPMVTEHLAWSGDIDKDLEELRRAVKKALNDAGYSVVPQV